MLTSHSRQFLMSEKAWHRKINWGQIEVWTTDHIQLFLSWVLYCSEKQSEWNTDKSKLPAKSQLTVGVGLLLVACRLISVVFMERISRCSRAVESVQLGNFVIADHVVVLAWTICDCTLRMFATKMEVAGIKVNAANSKALCREQEDCSLGIESVSLHL